MLIGMIPYVHWVITYWCQFMELDSILYKDAEIIQ